MSMIEDAFAYNRMSVDEKLTYWEDTNNCQPKRRKPSRWPKLLAALSYADKMIECFDFEEQRWFPLTEKPGQIN